MCFVSNKRNLTRPVLINSSRAPISPSRHMMKIDTIEGKSDWEPLAISHEAGNATTAIAEFVGSSQLIPAITTSATATAGVKRYYEVGKNGKNHPVIVVQHNYHDRSRESEADHQQRKHKPRGGVSVPFPLKLHDMLDKAMDDGYGHVVSWQPHGRCFVVHKPQEFQEIVLPMYFKLTKLSSFQRQLNLYGFHRLTSGRDRGGYYHELFLQNKSFLARDMQRVQVKGTGVRARSNPEQEPSFWTMTWCQSPSQVVSVNTVISDDDSSTDIDGMATRKDNSIPNLQMSNGAVSTTRSSLAKTKNMTDQHQNSTYLYKSKRTIDKIVDNDVIFSFGEKSFHYLDPFEPISLSENKSRCKEINQDNTRDEIFFDGSLASLFP
jgi:hypothetical protein